MTAVRITEVAATGFRNLSSVRVRPDPQANVLVGSNGQGKTSLLEAIDYTATLRSFRGASRAQLVGHGVPETQLLLRVESVVSGHEYRVKLSRNARDITLDGKRPERAIEYFGGAACVVFQPGDLELVRGAPETRRRLLDRMLMRTVDGYGEALKNYGKALRARNQLLRERSPNLHAIASFDMPLARYGAGIIRARERVVNELLGAAKQALDEVALTDDAITLSYRPQGPGDTLAFTAALAEQHQVDMARKTTTLGPHGDDLVITWAGHAARTVASQGQTRALALALRLAELHVVEARTKSVPVLLLDDVSSELDQLRTERLFALVGKLGAQVWVTTTDRAIAGLLPHAKVFEVDRGNVREEKGLKGS